MKGWTAVAVLLGLASAAAAARADECLTDWSVAAPIVKREGLVTVEQLSGLVRQHYQGDMVKTSLCDSGGGSFAFRIVIRAANGQHKTVLVDARDPFKP